jgi:hypothetical protein
MKTLLLLLDSHRMLLKLIEAKPDKYTLAERTALHDACMDVQSEVEMLIRVSENANQNP